MKDDLNKICTFIGHRRLAHDVKDELREQIRIAIAEDGVREFFCGGMGEFDLLCAALVREEKRRFPDVRLVLVLPSARSAASAPVGAYDEIVIPDASDGAHPKRAITLRNRWMIEQASLLIAYVQRDQGGAYTGARWAAKKKKPLRFIRENPEITQRLAHLTLQR